MTALATAFVEVRPDLNGFSRTLESGVGSTASRAGESAGHNFSSRFGTAVKGIATGLVAAFAITKGVDFFKSMISEATDAAVVTRRTANVIHSMGNASHISAKQVAQLATALSNKAGIDDQTIQSGQNLLLTFGHIRNEAGKGNKIFSQTSKLMVDLSVGMGQDMKSSAIQLGKALNDPVKGITALSRVGVSFTEQQKAQIKTLVTQGKTMQAQKIILGEVQKQFGGAAAAMATPAQKAAAAWLNFKQTLGTLVLPMFNKLMGFLSGSVIPVMTKFFTQMQSGKGAGGSFATALGHVVSAVKNVAAWIGQHIVPVLAQFYSWVAQKVVPAVMDFAHKALDGAKKGLQSIGKAIQQNKPQLQLLWDGIKKVVDVIVTKVLPALGSWARIYFPLLGKAIGKYIGWVGLMIRVVLKFVEISARAFRLFLTVVMDTFGQVLKGAAVAFGWMPGIGPKVKAASAAFQRFGTSAINTLQKIENQAKAMNAAMDNAARDRSFHVTTIYDSQGKAHSSGGHTAPGLATGGPVVRGRTYLVGERGPEMFTSNQSGRIIPNHQLAAAAGGWTNQQIDRLAERLAPTFYRATRDGIAERNTSRFAYSRTGA